MRRLGCLLVLMMATMAQSIALAAPPKLYGFDRKVRFMSLAEARAIALENGRVGQSSLLFPGIGIDNLVTTPKGESSIRMQVLGNPRSKSIILTGIAREPRPAEQERNLNQLLLNIENAYWNLYGSYWQLHSREQGLRLAYETWKLTGAQFKVGRLNRAAVAQAEGQYNLFRSQRLQALDTVLDNERQLRAMLGMAIEDGERLVPSDAPTLVEKKPDWKEGWYTAMKNRPELHLARKDVEDAKINLSIVEEIEVPLERAFGRENCETYESCEATEVKTCYPIRSLRPEPKADPKASPCQRAAQLRLARAYLVLQDQELKAERFLGLYYRRMSSAYFQIKAARTQREAFATQMKIREDLYRAGANEPGASTPVTLNLLLESQRFWAEAMATEYNAIVTYNNSLCGWEFAKGDIMKYAHVRFDEVPCGRFTFRAVACERQRTLQQVRREEAMRADSPLHGPDAGVSDIGAASSLPALWTRSPQLKEADDAETGPVEWKASEIFPPKRVHGGVSP